MGSLHLSDLIDEAEIAQLLAAYGPAPRQHVPLAMPLDGYIWWHKILVSGPNRRGEVVMVVRRGENLLVHSKAHYPADTYRLPTGGVNLDERVLDALVRELWEETGLETRLRRCLGVITYEFQNEAGDLPFVSYVFLVDAPPGELEPQDPNERIAAFRWVTVPELERLASQLQTLPPDWDAWGRFRAVAHKLVYEALA